MRSELAEDPRALVDERPGATKRALARWLLPLGVALAAGSLYWRTLAPGTVYLQDVAEFQTKLHTRGVIHATGYPLYQMLGKLWVTLLPFGSVAWRVNLLSALFSVIALVTLCRILQQVKVHPWAILGACGLLACSQSFWTYSILASTYTMHVALLSLSMLALLRWQKGASWGAWFALACGAGLAHHRVFVVVIPAFALAILLDDRTRSQLQDHWLSLGLLMVLPSLLSYGWLAIRGVWPLGRLFDYLFVEGASYVKHTVSVASWARRLVERMVPWIAASSGAVPALVGAIGWVVSLRADVDRMRRRTGLLLLAVGLVTIGFFSVAWIMPDNRRYFLQLDLALALGWGLSLSEAWEWLRRRLRGHWLRWPAHVVLAVTACVPLLLLYPKNLEVTAPYRDGYADRVSRRILATVEHEATVFGGWVLGWPLRYYTTVENLRPDVRVIVEPGGGSHRDLAIDLIEAGTPVYFREAMYGLDQKISSYAWMPMATGNVARAMASVPALAHTKRLTEAVVGDGLALRSVALSSWPLLPDTFVRLQLEWDDPGRVADEASVHLALRDATGLTHWYHDLPWAEARSEGSQTNVYWVTPPTLAPGDHVLHVELDSSTGKRLGEVQIAPVPVAAGSPLAADRLVLENRIDSPRPIPYQDPDLRLLGYSSIPQEIWAGHHQVPISLYWEVLQVPSAPYQATLVLEGLGSHIAVSDRCSVTAPYVGALARTACVLQAPSGTATERYRLTAVINNDVDSWPMPLQNVRLSDRPRVYRVPKMEHRLSARLGDSISLLGFDLSSRKAHPGEDLTLSLYWRAEADGEDWYKVFTHLVGSQGTLLAQHDSFPASGAAPTAEWMSGEVIVDDHTLSLPTDAAGGEYELFVGMYSPDTGERLVAQDPDGELYPDGAVPLGSIIVEMK